MAPSAIVVLCLLALASAAPNTLNRQRREVDPKVDEIMTTICTLSQGQSNKEVAPLVAEAIELLRLIPDDAVVEVLDKIRAGQYCADYVHLESLFLDAVAFVGEPGAFKVMAQEIAAGRTTGGRFSLYTVAANLLTKPTLNHVAALTPIFGMPDSNQLLSLAASTVVNRYCTQNADCDQAAPVKDILDLLSAKLNTQCTPDFSNVKTTQVLITLKSVGNIGKASADLFDSVMKCALTAGIETNVQFAATLSLRGVTCIEPMIKGLKSVVLDSAMNTEVRIGSYLAALRCATAGDLEEVITQMLSEDNYQVSGFILSHLANLKETNWPLKKNLKEMLSTKNVPTFTTNIFKESRNMEMSYITPMVEVGGVLDSNIVYAPESYVPRFVNLGLNMNLLGSFFNMGEVGARVEGLDPYFEDAIGPNSYLYKEVFGPDSYLYKTPLSTIVEDSQLFATSTGTELVQLVKDLIKEKNININTIIEQLTKLMQMGKDINVDSIQKIINQLLKEYKNIDVQALLKSVDVDAIVNAVVNFLKTNNIQLPRTDLYAILRNQERAFLSFGGQQNKFTVNELVETIVPVIMDAILGAKDFNVDALRTGQLNLDFAIPTISGIPLKIKLTGTAVAGIKIINNLDANKSSVDALLKIIPSLNAHVEAQIGFGDSEFKFRTTAYTTNGFSLNVALKNGEDLELQLELPEKMELFDIQSEVILMNEVKMKDLRIESNGCSGIIEPVTGLLICYGLNVPDVVNSNSLPLGKPIMARVYLQKSDPEMKGYRLAAKLRNKPGKKLLKIAAGTYGSANSKQSSLKLTYTNEADTYITALNIQSTLIKSTTEVTFINQPEYKSLQVYNNEILGSFAPLQGSVKIEFKPVTLDNGNTYEVSTYAGLTKSLNEKHRLFQMMLSLLENGDMNNAKFITKTDIFPAMFEVEVNLPKNAGLRVYKVEKISVRSSVSTFVVEGSLVKKSPEVFQTTLLVLNSESTIINMDVVQTISIDSPLIGGAANKFLLMTSVNGKIPFAEFGFVSKLNYENGVLVVVLGNSEVLEFNSKLTYKNLVLEVSNGLNFYKSDLVLLNSKLNIGDLAFKTEIGVPMLGLGLRSKWFCNELVLQTSTVALYTGSEIVSMNSKFGYVNGFIEISGKAKYLENDIFSAIIQQSLDTLPFNLRVEVSVPSVFYVNLQHTIDSRGLTTVAQIDIPAVIKSLKINHVFGINSAFSYQILTDVKSGDLVLLHIEGPVAFEFSNILVKQNLNIKISGAFEGTIKIMHAITMSPNEIQYTVDMRHGTNPIVVIDINVGVSVEKGINVKSMVNLPFVIESDLAATITTSLIHSTIKTLALPSTPYARRFKGSAEFNWVENNFKGDLYWDAEKDNDMKIELTTKYALDTTALKFVIQGDLTVTSLIFGYKLESVLASPFEWFQGVSGIEFTGTMPSKKIFVCKDMLEIQYSDSQVTLKPTSAFITTNDNKYELTTPVVVQKLPGLLNFVITSEIKLTTPQLKQITFVTSLMHEDKDQAGKISLIMRLEESVLSDVISFEYEVLAEKSKLSTTVKVIKGSNTATLTNVILLKSGVTDFEITNEMTMPFIGLNSLATKLIKTPEGTTSLALIKNQELIVRVYYSMPSLTSHIVGIEFPSRTLEFNAALASNQVIFKAFPEKNKSAKVVETTFKLLKKAGAGQFEVLVTAPSLSKEMRFAVELELIEPGKAKYDMVSIDVQYQVSEAPKLLTATLNELKNIYVDLVNDGMCPDLNKWYRKVQKFVKKAPKFLNSMRDELNKSIPKYYEFVKSYVTDLYQLYEADIIAMWNTVRAELLRYLNIVKAKAPELLNNYIDILKKTETWNVVQSLLSELLVNYPVYYDAVVDFYNKVIVTYVTELTAIVGNFLVLPEIDVSQYVAILKKEVSAIIKIVVNQLLDSQMVKLAQGKIIDFLALYPNEFSLLEDVYTSVILPTSYEVFVIANKMLAISDFDYQKYLNVIISDVPELLNKLSQRIIGTQIVNKLRATFPTIFIIIEDIYTNVILPALNDMVAFIKKVTALPVDFQEYWTISKVEVPVIAGRFVQSFLDTQMVKELKATFPVVFEISEDFYNKVIISTLEDILVLAEKFIAFPIVDIQETIKQYWGFIKAEVPPMFNKFVQRLPETKLVQKLKTLNPAVFDIANDFYAIIIVPTVSDIVAVVEKIISIPLADVQEVVQQLFDILKVEMPTLIGKFFERLPETQIVKLIKENSTVLLELLQEQLTVLKNQYPVAYATALDFYNKVAVPAYSDLNLIYGKLIKVSDIYQLGDLVKTEVFMLIKNLVKNIATTDLMNIVISNVNELVALYPEEYQSVLGIYNQVSQIKVTNILATVNSYINEEFGITYSISAEKLTVVLPLPVSVTTVRNYIEIITVYAPAYVTDVVAQLLVQGRILYKSIQAQIPVIVDYINTQAPIYLQYINNYLNTLQVIIPEYVEQIKANLPKLVHNLQEIVDTIGKPLFDVMAMYPEVFEAIDKFMFVSINLCSKYVVWAVNTIVEYPLVKTVIDYIVTLTPEKAQATLVTIVDFVMSSITQLEARINVLIAAIPKEIPAFIEMHIPAFIISLITSILSYLN